MTGTIERGCLEKGSHMRISATGLRAPLRRDSAPQGRLRTRRPVSTDASWAICGRL
jgi:hypothetical protein